jgi:hypothetical protein
VPRLARSVGLDPVFFPPEGGFGHAAVHAQPLPVDALQPGVFQQPGLPQRGKDAGGHPLLKTVMGGGTGAELGGVQGFPLAAGAQDEQDGIHADAVGGAGPSAAQAMRVDVWGQVHLDFRPQGIGDPPVVGEVVWVHDGTKQGQAVVRN